MAARCRQGSALPLFFVVGLALAGSRAHAEGSESACDLEPWVADVAAPGEQGYHVLCATGPGTLRVYRLGVRAVGEVFTYEGPTLRKGLTNLLKIKRYIEYPASKEHKKLKWKKQPWALFTAEGDELPKDEEADQIAGLFGDGSNKLGVVLLLFEGGAWRWPTISVGYRRDVSPGLWLRTVARQPALFEVKIDDVVPQPDRDDHLSIQLLANVVSIAEKRLVPSSTEGKVDKKMRSSDQTFLSYDQDPQLKKLKDGTIKLLHTSQDHLEPLQVLRYGVNQHYDAHRDYWDPREFPDVPRFTSAEGFWHQRFATLLWYLSPPIKGGETWFPRAHGGPIPWNEWMACDERGAMVSPSNATAVLFYSLRADGEIDEFSWHCGCKVQEGVKWAANSWMSISPKAKRRKRTDL